MSTGAIPPKQPLSPTERQRLQQWFQHGSKNSGLGNFDYATDMFVQCVKGDPGNPLYVQNYLGNLQKKYNNNKSGGKLASIRGAGLKGAVKKALLQKNWTEVIQQGLEMLKLNPWDTSVLADMANACAHLDFEESRVVYLMMAVDANLQDPETNRLLARALAAKGDFDTAINCWRRVLVAKPNDEEGAREITSLTARRTIRKGGYEDAETSTAVMADKQAQLVRQGKAPNVQESPEQALERQIRKDPANVSRYLELTDLHIRNEKLEDAEKVLERALAASGGEMLVRERLEDVQVRRYRQQVAVAEKRAHDSPTPEAQELVQQMKTELNNKELEIYRNRCERHPQNLAFKYEMGVRLQRAKNFNEAIKVLQESRSDPKRKAAVLYALGACFEAIKQYKLAMTNYEGALAEIPERDGDQRKAALYRAGVLAMALKDYVTADQHLTSLAGLDFAYKDVGDRLDKLAKLREDNDSA